MIHRFYRFRGRSPNFRFIFKRGEVYFEQLIISGLPLREVSVAEYLKCLCQHGGIFSIRSH